MKHPQEFDSLENWADRSLKDLQHPKAPKGFADLIMRQVQSESTLQATFRQVACAPGWIRWLTVAVSLLLLSSLWIADFLGGMTLFDVASSHSAFSASLQLFNSVSLLLEGLLQMIPAYVWMSLGVVFVSAYLLTILMGSLLYHWNGRRHRVLQS